ncbi:hypothetical protein Zmor_027149 [Zophobas morio]|uniref:Uncharacterized protein n=1 Tax=Zophobas morio TaxID=2755281 RepID=A0AA38HNL3_9CUCU|nr:hypothetical protein Zmor_027149 [Zophobas morio]
MAARFALIFLAAVVIFQVIMLDAHVMRRDAPTGSTASDDLDGALQSFKSSLDDLVKNIQNNELLANVSQSLKAFGEKVQNQSQQLVEKIQSASKTK